MTIQTQKSRRGGNPSWTGNPSNTKSISFDRREIKVARDHASEKLRLLRLHAGIRFNDLGRLVAYRRRHALNIGSEFSWAVVLANLSEALGTTADVFAVHDLARRLGLPEIDADIAAAACRSGDGLLLSAVVVGEFLEVSSCERTDARLRNVEAVDECAEDRKRRIARDRQRRRRAVTRPYQNRKRDTVRKTGGGSRCFASRLAKGRTSTALASRQEPRASSFFSGRTKGQAGTTAGELDSSSSIGVADAFAGSKSEPAYGSVVIFHRQPATPPPIGSQRLQPEPSPILRSFGDNVHAQKHP